MEARFAAIIHHYYDLPQLDSISAYDFLLIVDFFAGRDVPFFFLALILFTREFFTPSLFFFGVRFLAALAVDFFFFPVAAFGFALLPAELPPLPTDFFDFELFPFFGAFLPGADRRLVAAVAGADDFPGELLFFGAFFFFVAIFHV